MLTPEEIREIARHQRARGVEVAGLRRNQDSIRIRISMASVIGQSSAPASGVEAQLHAAASTTVKVRSGNLGMVVLSGLPELPKGLLVGDRVEKAQVMGFIQLGDDLTPVAAPCAGTVAAVLVQPGQRADYGMALFELTPAVGDSK